MSDSSTPPTDISHVDDVPNVTASTRPLPDPPGVVNSLLVSLGIPTFRLGLGWVNPKLGRGQTGGGNVDRDS